MSPKYPRTMHVPWSPGASKDDRIANDVSTLLNVPIIISEKVDGSNTSLEFEGCFSRSHSGTPTHPSFDMLKVLQASKKYLIPKGIQFFGEWCYALHSIPYDSLPGYFLLFGVRDHYVERDTYWYSWSDVENFAIVFDVPTVPILFKGVVGSEKELQELMETLMIQSSACGGIREGVVVRLADKFEDKDFSTCVMKCVRANHVQTSEHWKDQEIVKNKLKIPNVGS